MTVARRARDARPSRGGAWRPASQSFATSVVSAVVGRTCQNGRAARQVHSWAPTEAAAIATLPIAAAKQYDLFAYWLAAEKLEPSAQRVAVRVDDFLDPRLPPLPLEPLPGLIGFDSLGYDVVSHEGHLGFGHSPLSCNDLAEEVPVNRFCLIDDREEAIRLAWRFDEETPEPGPYFVVRVLQPGR